jgi:hypothetical protein
MGLPERGQGRSGSGDVATVLPPDVRQDRVENQEKRNQSPFAWKSDARTVVEIGEKSRAEPNLETQVPVVQESHRACEGPGVSLGAGVGTS